MTAQPLTYTPKLDHRNKSPEKSQWTIDLSQEERCFQIAHGSNWIDTADDKIAWGLHYDKGGCLAHLGLSAKKFKRKKSDPLKRLFIAKFINSYGRNDWHGYPADQHNCAPYDIPPTMLLRRWMKENVLPKALASRLMQGRSCDL